MKTDLRVKRKYRIRKRLPFEDLPYWDDIFGYRVIIAGFEEYEFFVHRNPNMSFLALGDKWRVSEVTSGFAFPDRCDGKTREEAISNTTGFLNERGKPRFLNAMAKVAAGVFVGR